MYDIEDANLVLVFLGRFRLDRNRWKGGGPRPARRVVQFQSFHVELHEGSEVDARLGNETGRELLA